MSDHQGNKAVRAGLGYTVGNILIKGVNIFTLPIFSRLMSPEEFGVFNVFLSYDAILFVIMGLALHSSIRSANTEFKGKIDEYTSSISLIYIINTLILVVLVTAFGGFFSILLGYDRAVLYMLIFYSTGTAIVTLFNNRLSLDYSYKKYLVVALINSVGNVSLSLVLILTAFRDAQAFGRILGSTAVVAILALFLLAGFYCKAKPRFNRKFWSFGLKYSLPIVPHGISQVLLGQFDRIMIRELVSDAASGVYSLAGNIKLILTVITTSVSTAWTTWFYSEMEQGNRDAVRKRATQLAALFTILAVGLMALAPELVYILGGPEYDAGKYVAIPMILDAFVLFLYDIVVSGEYFTKKTIYIMLGTLFAAIMNVLLNYVFILKYGFIAAAYTTLFAYVCYLVLHLIISRRLLGFCILPMRWLAVFCLIVTFMAVADLLLLGAIIWRWLVCAVVVIPMALLLLRSLGGIGVLAGKQKGE